MQIAFPVHDPEHRSLRKAGRTALVMSTAFLVGVHVVDNSQFAVIAAFTAAALLGIADFSGTRTQRLRATSATSAAGAALLALGTAVSSDTVAAAITMFAVTLVVGYTAVFSGYFTAASSAVIVFYVVGTGVEGPVSVIPAREAGLAVATALSLLAIGWLWPSRSEGMCRQSLGAVYEVLAEAVSGLDDRLGSGDQWSGVQTDDRLAKAILDAERTIATSAWRPDGLASPHKARMYLLQGARRLSELIGFFDDLPRQSIADPDGTTAHLIRGMATELHKCAAALATNGSELPDPGSIETENDRFVEAARHHFARHTGQGGESAGPGQYAERVFVLHQMSWSVMLASVCCRAVQGAPLDAPPLIAQCPLVNTMTDGPSVRKWMRRARRNLNPRSVHLQNSLRLATGLGLARLLVGALGLQHGFWVGFATLVVLKTSSAGTRSTAFQAAVGTTIGFGISAALVTTFGVDAPVYSILLPVVIFAAFYLPGAVSFVAGQACFTIVIVVLFNLLKPSGWTVGLIRLEDVLIGSAIGLTIGMAIWPRGAASELFRILARLYVSGSDYAKATVETMVATVSSTMGPSQLDVEAFRCRAEADAVDAEDVFSQFLSEPHQSDAPVLAWSELMASAHQLWFGTTLVGLFPVVAGSAAGMPELCRGLVASAARLNQTHRSLAATLLGEGVLKVDHLPLISGPIDRSAPRSAMTLLELDAWMRELSLEVDRVRPVLQQLGRDEPAKTVAPRMAAASP